MSTLTTNLNLFKYDTVADAQTAFSITQALNNNWDILDNLDRELVPLESGTINLQKNKTLYNYTIAGATTFTFSTTNLSLSTNRAYTFELLLTMSTVYALTFPTTVKWQDSKTPAMTSAGTYFFAFRTIDGGSTWKGSLQGVWQ